MPDTHRSLENTHSPLARLGHRPSLFGGLALMLLWCAYAIFLIISSFDLPDGGEAMSLLAVAAVMFVLGWTAVFVATHLMSRLYRRIVS